MKCPECGEELPKGVRQCPNCDYELTDSEFAAANPQPEVSSVTPQKPTAPQQPASPQKPQSSGAEMPESILSHGDVNVSSDHSTHNTQNTTHNTQNNIANTTNTTNNTQQTIIINVGAGGQLPGGIVDEGTTRAVNDMAASQPQKQPDKQSDTKGVGSIAGVDNPVNMDDKKKPIGLISGIAVVIILIVGWFVFGNKNEETVSEQQSQVEVVETAPAKSSSKSEKAKTTSTTEKLNTTATTTESAAKAITAPSANTNSKASVKTDPYQAGLEALSSGNYSKAVEQLTAAANSGNGDAAFKLGEMYETGNGVTQDKNTAISWYQKAKSLGNKAAKRKLM